MSFLTFLYPLGCFHTSTFVAHQGSIDFRVWFVWMTWTLFSELVCAPTNRTHVCIKRVWSELLIWWHKRTMIQTNVNTIQRGRGSNRTWVQTRLTKCEHTLSFWTPPCDNPDCTLIIMLWVYTYFVEILDINSISTKIYELLMLFLS